MSTARARASPTRARTTAAQASPTSFKTFVSSEKGASPITETVRGAVQTVWRRPSNYGSHDTWTLGKKAGLIVGIIVISLIVLGLLLCFLYKRRQRIRALKNVILGSHPDMEKQDTLYKTESEKTVVPDSQVQETGNGYEVGYAAPVVPMPSNMDQIAKEGEAGDVGAIQQLKNGTGEEQDRPFTGGFVLPPDVAVKEEAEASVLTIKEQTKGNK